MAMEKTLAPSVVRPPWASSSAWNSRMIVPTTAITAGPKMIGAEARAGWMRAGAGDARHFQRRQDKGEGAGGGQRQPRFRALANNFLQGNGSGDDKGRRCGEPADGVPDRKKAFHNVHQSTSTISRRRTISPLVRSLTGARSTPFGTPRPRTRTTQFQRQVSWLAGRRVSVQPSRSVCSPRVEIGEATSGRLLLRNPRDRSLSAHSCGDSRGYGFHLRGSTRSPGRKSFPRSLLTSPANADKEPSRIKVHHN